MKKFGFHIFLLFTIIVFLLFTLEALFNGIYSSSNPRFKFQYLVSQKNKNIDYIFIGSSRVENGIIPKLIEHQTGKSVINLGFQAAKLNDINLLLQMLKKLNISNKKIFIQIDYIYNIEDAYSNILQYEIAPFISYDSIIEDYIAKANPQNQFVIKNVPFYKYILNSPKLGVREVFAQIIQKKNKAIIENGFVALDGSQTNSKYSLPNQINKKNSDFDKIQNYCKKENIEVIYFIAPFYKDSKNLNYIEKLKNKVPNILDLSASINESKYFNDNAHLNREGAKVFTQIVINKMNL